MPAIMGRMALAPTLRTSASLRLVALLTLVAACLACSPAAARAAEAREPAVAPPATPKVAAACERANRFAL